MRRQLTKQQLLAGLLTWLSRHSCTAIGTEQCKEARVLSGLLQMQSVMAGLLPCCLPNHCSASGVCAGPPGVQQTSKLLVVRDKLNCKVLSRNPAGIKS